MKNKIIILTIFLFMGCVFHVQLVYANEFTNNNTTIEVEIKDNELMLGKVQTLNFGTHRVSSKQSSYQATQDLTIQIIDKRVTKKTPWQVYYQLSDFYGSDSSSFYATLHFRSGYLLAKTTKGRVKIRNLKIKTGTDKYELFEFQSNTSEDSIYEFVIPKQDIYLTIPADINAGKYEAVQIITLQNVPQQN